MINLLHIIKRQFNFKTQLLTNELVFKLLDENVTLSPEQLAIHIHRLQNKIVEFFGEGNSYELLLALSYIQRMYTQIEIYYSAIIGENFRIMHGLGTVIGARVVIGNNVTIYQNVTLGGKDGDKGRPIIGDNSIIWAGSIILGSSIIGKNSIVGANSVVVDSFPDNSVVAGVPAKLLKKNENRIGCP